MIGGVSAAAALTYIGNFAVKAPRQNYVLDAMKHAYPTDFFEPGLGKPRKPTLCSYCGGPSRADSMHQCRGCGAPA